MLADTAPVIAPARSDRQWMDAFTNRWAYRCLPLTVANSTGWEILCPYGFTAEWSGGPECSDLVITPDDPAVWDEHFVRSHFSCGVMTFHPGYLFRTESGVALRVSGSPNHIKHGIHPMEGIVETDWLPYTFTMNWIFTAPGKIRFDQGEPFCFIAPAMHYGVDDMQPVISQLTDEPELSAQVAAWTQERDEFTRLRAGGNLKEDWQKFYFNGKPPEGGGPVPAKHVNKRRLKAPE